ncbi:MAG: hypothetical protein VB091_12740 [Christensenella sp.]|nr:hypothetical protein [Christensenella sp.]
MTNRIKNSSWVIVFSVASVLFGWHAGGGFATGNQANVFFVSTGWWAPFSAVLAVLLLTLAVRQAMIMYNQRGLTNYKQLFSALYHPFDWLGIAFEIYFYIMVLMATSASIAGAGMLFQEVAHISYFVAVCIIGLLLLTLTMFGADLVRRASLVMSVLILICALSIFLVGIVAKSGEITAIAAAGPEAAKLPNALLQAFQYAGFQCASIPTMVACGAALVSQKQAKRSMWISFAMNAVALCLSVVMLLGWKSVYSAIDGGSVIPTLTVCKQLGMPLLIWAYDICLFLCFLSTGTASVFGLTERFCHTKAFHGLKSAYAKRAAVAFIVMAISMTVSFAGLTNIVKYGYGYCGYAGIVLLVIPFLTVGAYKNKKYRENHPEISERFPA